MLTPAPTVEDLPEESDLIGVEVRQHAAWSFGVGLVALINIPFVTAIRGPPVWLAVEVVALAAVAIIAFSSANATRNGVPQSTRIARLNAIVTGMSGIAMIPYWGIESPVPAGLMFLVAYYSQSRDRTLAIAFTIMISIGYLTMVGADRLGVIPSGVFATGSQNLTSLFRGIVIPGLFWVATVWGVLTANTARSSIRATIAHARSARLRAAELDEARSDLVFAAQSGTATGAYTGLLAGRFLLRERIGIGGMAEVYAATSLDGADQAAVKVLRLDLRDPELFMRRFEREGLLVSQLKSPFVVRVLQLGLVGSQGRFIAMERLFGADLSSLMSRAGGLSVEEVVDMVAQIACGLDAAHDLGIVHRDIKPSNLYRYWGSGGGDGWKILDFGIASAAAEIGLLTESNVLGTPDYMAPEQLTGKAVGAWSDVWGLAATAYRALTGHAVTVGDTPAERLYSLTAGRPYRPRDLDPSLSHEVELVLALGLHPVPAKRIARASDFASALRHAVQREITPLLKVRATESESNHPWRRLMAR